MKSRRVCVLIAFLLTAGAGCRMGYEETVPLELDDGGEGADGWAAGAAGDTGSELARGGSSSGEKTVDMEGGQGGAPNPTDMLGGEGGTPEPTVDAGGGGLGGSLDNHGGAAGAGGDGGSGDTSGSAGFGGAAGAPNGALCNTGMYAEHSYLLCKEERDWSAAMGGCVAIGMRLVRVDDAAENQWLFDNAYTEVGRVSTVWIGATDRVIEGEWRWSDGALFWIGSDTGAAQNGLFNAWYFREPNNVSGAEHCASIETNGSAPVWYDSRCENAAPFICESL